MRFMHIIRQFTVTTLGFLAALLLYHYHQALAHLVADGFTAIPWHSKYFWPIGGPWWALPILVITPVGSWFYATRRATTTDSLFEATTAALAAIIGIIVCFGLFGNGYILPGLSVAGFSLCFFTGLAVGEERGYPKDSRVGY